MKQTYDHLISQVQEMELELQEAKAHNKLLKHQAESAKQEADKLRTQARTMQTLNLGVFSQLSVAEICAVVCESVVYQLGWDSCFIIGRRGNRLYVKASFQATKKQLDHLHDYLSANQAFMEAYEYKNALTTYSSSDKSALSLRALFQTEEVVAMPILVGEHIYGYLVVCAHSASRSLTRTPQDVEFLSTLAVQVAHAIHNSEVFKSLEEQNVKLKELDEAKDSFIAITSHQLRTPLSIIKWILSILQSDEQLAGFEKQRALVSEAYESNERLIRVVNDLLNVSRIQEGQLPYNPQLMDISDIVHDILKKAGDICHLRQRRLEIEVQTELPEIEADPLLLREALQNLVDNAIDYNHQDGLVRFELQTTEKELRIKVTNEGPGISAEDQQRVFNQFFRTPEAMKLQPNGSGLGLYITQSIIREHKGVITCESGKDQPTTFSITLPLPAHS